MQKCSKYGGNKAYINEIDQLLKFKELHLFNAVFDIYEVFLETFSEK